MCVKIVSLLSRRYSSVFRRYSHSDIVHDCWLKLSERFSGIPFSYVFQTVKNHLNDILKQERREKIAYSCFNIYNSSQFADTEHFNSSVISFIASNKYFLNKRHVQCLFLLYLNFNQLEISEILSVSQPYVSMILNEAKMRLYDH